MAALTSTFPFKPLLPYAPRTTLSLSSSSSSPSYKLFGPPLRLYKNPNYSSNLTLLFISGPRASIAANYGGGFSRSDPTDSVSDDDLDMSLIRSEEVRLIDEKQKMVGIVSKSVAVQMAEDAELDLVIVSPDADPPVVKIMDYNKYKYEMQKKKRDQQKKSAAHRMDMKELKMGYNIDVHDYAVRLKAAKKFFKDGYKVRVIVNLKGRENQFKNNAIELLRRFQNDIGELAVEESKNFRDKNISLVLVPNKAVLQKAQELPKKKENPTAADLVTKYSQKTA